MKGLVLSRMSENSLVRKIHIHSDCDFFAGCENMLSVFANSTSMNQDFNLSISFRETESYLNGFNLRAPYFNQKYPLKLQVPEIFQHFDVSKYQGLRRLLRFVLYLIQLVFSFAQNFFVLVKFFRRLRPDILQINNGGYPGALSCRVAVVAAKVAGIKRILLFSNNMAVNYDSPYRKFDWLLDRYVAKNVSFFLTGSVEASNQLERVLKIPPQRRKILANATEIRGTRETRDQTLSRLNISPENSLVIGMVGLMLPRKGHRLLLDAIVLARLDVEFLKLKPIFLIEGEEAFMEGLREFIEREQLDSMVRLIGREERIFEFYSALDFLVYPSIVHEDFPNVISEAMSVGVPVISSRVAGAVEQIQDSINGYLFNVGDFRELASIFCKIARTRENRSSMSREAELKYRINYTPQIVISKYSELYLELLGEKVEK
jgi:glycosyltransferase involved in cell wall biosynthesis